jgi:Replication-relaxation
VTVPRHRHGYAPAGVPARVEIPAGGLAAAVAATRGLTARDRQVIDYLHRHQALTALQLARLVFGSYSHARSRLAILHDRGILARFRAATWPGSSPWQYALAPAAAALHAAATGRPLPRPAHVTEHVLRLASSPQAAHRAGVCGFFAALAGHARQQDSGRELAQWWTPAETADACAGIVRPDAYGEYSEDGRTLRFFLEYDTGTEPIATLTGKIGRYAELAAAGITLPVLFHLPATAREASFRHAITGRWPAGPPVPVATLPADQLGPDGYQLAPGQPSAAGSLWLPAGHHHRRTLAALAPAGAPAPPLARQPAA